MKNNAFIQGRYRFKKYAIIPGLTESERFDLIKKGLVEPKSVSRWHKNKVVVSNGYGINVIIRQLTGDASIPIAVDELQLGTGTTAAANGDTELETAVVTGIIRASQSIINNDEAHLSFFVSDLAAPSTTYNEIGIFCGEEGDRRLFARSIISPGYEKSDAEDTTIEYVIEINSV